MSDLVYRSYCEHGELDGHPVEWDDHGPTSWCLGGNETKLPHDGLIHFENGNTVLVAGLLEAVADGRVTQL